VVETGREGFGKAGSKPMDLSEKKLCSVGSEWVYIFNRRKAKKEISGKMSPSMNPGSSSPKVDRRTLEPKRPIHLAKYTSSRGDPSESGREGWRTELYSVNCK